MTFVSRKVLGCIIEYAHANVSKSESNGNNSDFATEYLHSENT